MARISRKLILEDNSYFHVTWKCHNNDFLLKDTKVKTYLYNLLKAYKHKYKIKIYGYCFMDNHPHIVGYCESVELFSAYFRVVNGLLARFINRSCGRMGQVIMDRFRSPRIQDERHMTEVLHYVDLNPVRAGICAEPKFFTWSSYRHHAFGTPDALVDPLPKGVQINPADYRALNTFIFKRGKTISPIYSKTFFIGTPQWVRNRQRHLHLQLVKQKCNTAGS